MLNAAAPGLHEPVTPAVMARSSPEPVRPLNISPSEFCRQIGVKKTAGYGLIAKHAVRIIKLGPHGKKSGFSFWIDELEVVDAAKP